MNRVAVLSFRACLYYSAAALRDWREGVETTTVEREAIAPLAWAPFPDIEVPA